MGKMREFLGVVLLFAGFCGGECRREKKPVVLFPFFFHSSSNVFGKDSFGTTEFVSEMILDRFQRLRLQGGELKRYVDEFQRVQQIACDPKLSPDIFFFILLRASSIGKSHCWSSQRID